MKKTRRKKKWYREPHFHLLRNEQINKDLEDIDVPEKVDADNRDVIAEFTEIKKFND